MSKDRNCKMCVYHSENGCSQFNCQGTTTVDDIKADERAKVLNEVLGLKPQIYTWLIKREKGGYGTTLGECTDKIFEEIEKVFKSHK